MLVLLLPIMGIAWMDMNHATDMARRATKVAVDKINEIEDLRVQMMRERQRETAER